MNNLIGQSLGRYHILEQLGEGGMATVYKAYDTRLETDVAVKVIRTEALPQNAVERALKRFEREAKALARLTHPNIVKVTDYGEFEGKPYIVMEYLPSGTLKSKLRGKPMPWQEAARLLIPIGRALDFAHRQGMIHRDVKPSNILITADGEPMLTDFGIAKMLDLEETMDLTGTNAAVGTPEYMAPEQATSKSVDARADIYALGVVFYEMVTGRKPYTADTPMAVIIKQASEPLPRPRTFVPDLPQTVENVLLKALAKKPEDRYQNMAEMVVALENLLTGAVRKGITGNLPRQGGKAPVLVSHRWPPFWVWAAVIVIVFVLFLLKLAPSNDVISETPVPGQTSIPASTYTPASTSIPIFTSTPELGVGSTMSGQDSMTLLYVPAGNFLMGSSDLDKLASSDEKPQHTVNLDAFWIDQADVTNAMYAKCVSAGVCNQPNNLSSLTHSSYYGKHAFDNYPVINVTWNMADTYCKWAGRQLPTEAQWEKAARGMDGRIYPWGNSAPDNTLLNYNSNVGDTTAVGNYPKGASPYGALDMAGDVWQWMADWYSDTYYQSSPSSNPFGPDSGQVRVMRGGSWLNQLYDLRSASRSRFNPSSSFFVIGFRCSRSQP